MITSKKGSSAGEQTITWIFYFAFLIFVIFVIVAALFLNITSETDIRSADALTHAGLLHYNNYYNNCDDECVYVFSETLKKKVGINYSSELVDEEIYNLVTYKILSPIATKEISEGSGGAERHVFNFPDERIEVLVKND